MKVEIILKNDAPGEKTVSQIDSVPQGIISSPKKQKHLARRLKKSSGIRFFDLGWKNGADLYASFLPEVTGDPESLQFLIDAISESQEKELTDYIQSQILGVAPENWQNTFRKIVKSATFSKAITVFSYLPDNVTQLFPSGTLDNLTQFENDTLKLTSEEAAGLAIFPNGELFYPAFYYFRALEANIKITSIADIEADPVEFVPSPQMDIFLTPAIFFNSAYTRYYNGVNEYNFYNKYDLLNNFYSTIPREIWKQLYDALGVEWLMFPNGYTDYYFVWTLLKQFPEARMFHGVETDNESPTPPDRVYTSPETSAFPFNEIYTPSGIVETDTNIDNGYGINLGVSAAASKLTMVIKKGNEYFYFWHVV